MQNKCKVLEKGGGLLFEYWRRVVYAVGVVSIVA